MAKDNPDVAGGDNSTAIAGDAIRAFIERIENIQQEEADRRADKKEIFAEAKGQGFDTKILRQIVRLRKQDRAEREEQETLLALYDKAADLGIFG